MTHTTPRALGALLATAVALAATPATAQSVAIRPDGDDVQLVAEGLPALSADGATVVTVSTAPRASGAPNLTVHRYDVRRQRALPTQVVLSVAEAERAMAGAAPLAAMRAVVEARVAATQALFRTLGLRTLTRGGEATADAARTEAWRDIDSSRVRSAMGWLTVTLRAAPVPARFRMRLPAAGTGLRCRDANPGYLGAAWIERSLLVARIDYAGTNLCQAPAPRWVVRAVRVP